MIIYVCTKNNSKKKKNFKEMSKIVSIPIWSNIDYKMPKK